MVVNPYIPSALMPMQYTIVGIDLYVYADAYPVAECSIILLYDQTLEERHRHYQV